MLSVRPKKKKPKHWINIPNIITALPHTIEHCACLCLCDPIVPHFIFRLYTKRDILNSKFFTTKLKVHLYRRLHNFVGTIYPYLHGVGYFSLFTIHSLHHKYKMKIKKYIIVIKCVHKTLFFSLSNSSPSCTFIYLLTRLSVYRSLQYLLTVD